MVEMVDARRSAETKEERRDLFSGLLGAAHDDPDISVAITDEELFSKSQLSYCIALSDSLPQAICSSSSSPDMRYGGATPIPIDAT